MIRHSIAAGIRWVLNEYGTLLLQRDKTESARKVFTTLTKKYPRFYPGHNGLAKAVAQSSDPEAELGVWRRFHTISPSNPAGQMKLGDLLRETDRFEEAEAHYQKMLERAPRSRAVLSALAKTASNARNYPLAALRWDQLTELFPEDVRFRRNLIRALVETLDFERAQTVYDTHASDASEIQCLVQQADIYLAQSDVDNALLFLNALHLKHPDDEIIVRRKLNLLASLRRTTGEAKYGEQALALLDTYEARNPVTSQFMERRIELNILQSSPKNAQALLKELPPDGSQKNRELHAWGVYMRGDVDTAKAMWHDITALYYPTRIRPPKPGSMQRTDSNTLDYGKDSILLFTAVRNERWRLTWFLDYYRSLGVDRFFFVDNGSTDGTAEYLLEQPDVYVFWTDQSYASAYSGIQWINWLIEEYGADCWCIYADVDEALVFPGSEKRSLRQLTCYMSDNGHEAMYAFMLDMYAPHLDSIARKDNYTGFLPDYPMFENEYSWINTPYCPFRFTAGGIRRTFKLSENQTKTPIIRGGKGIKYLMSSHQITPAVLSDVSAVFLHYKLAGDFKEIFSADLTDNTRIARCQMRHWKYLQALESLPNDESFVHSKTVSFESSNQLLELGILTTSADFEAANYD